jgi:hypothetical protein
MLERVRVIVTTAFLRLLEVGALVAIAVVLCLQYVDHGRL